MVLLSFCWAPLSRAVATGCPRRACWILMQGTPPIGAWELTLPSIGDIKRHIKDGDIENMLFVITYSGITPDWPR